jgi:hypothetical protein
MVSTAEMGVPAMKKQSENKTTITNTINKPEQNSVISRKDGLSEQDLENVTGGIRKSSGGTVSGSSFLRFIFK